MKIGTEPNTVAGALHVLHILVLFSKHASLLTSSYLYTLCSSNELIKVILLIIGYWILWVILKGKRMLFSLICCVPHEK